MRRGRRLFSGLFAKMFSLSFGLGILLFLSLLACTVLVSRAALATQTYETNLQVLNGIDNSLTSAFQEIGNVLMMVTNIEDVEDSPAPYVGKMLSAFVGANRNTIGGIYVMKADGTVIADRQTVFDVVGNGRLAALYDGCLANPDVVIHSEPYYSPVQTSMTVAFMRGIRRRGSQGLLGVCVVEANLDRIAETLLSGQGGRTFTFVIHTDEAPVAYDHGSPLLRYAAPAYPALNNRLDAELERFVMDLPLGSSDARAAGRRFIALKRKLRTPGFYGVLLFDAGFFHASTVNLVRTFIAIGCVYTLLLVVTNLLLSRHFTRPIHALAEKMDGTSITARIPAPPMRRDDEIGMLHEHFDSMLGRIERLMRKQKRTEARKREIELQLLRAQLKPHFLCNTLACVGSLSRQGRHREVQETIRSLIIILVASFDKGEEMVPLAKELELVDAFVAIQKIRFGDSFEYVRTAPAEGSAVPVPKLLLLPLVENAVVHGMAGRRSGGRIEIHCACTGKELVIRISDNGKGIGPERLREIEAKPGGKKPGTGLQPKLGHTIGIRNVQDRIRLHYGPHFGLRIGARSHGGTLVTIRLPATPAGARATGTGR